MLPNPLGSFPITKSKPVLLPSKALLKPPKPQAVREQLAVWNRSRQVMADHKACLFGTMAGPCTVCGSEARQDTLKRKCPLFPHPLVKHWKDDPPSALRTIDASIEEVHVVSPSRAIRSATSLKRLAPGGSPGTAANYDFTITTNGNASP